MIYLAIAPCPDLCLYPFPANYAKILKTYPSFNHNLKDLGFPFDRINILLIWQGFHVLSRVLGHFRSFFEACHGSSRLYQGTWTWGLMVLQKQLTPGFCIITEIWHCPKIFGQWEHNFHGKLYSHWLNKNVTVSDLWSNTTPRDWFVALIMGSKWITWYLHTYFSVRDTSFVT